MNGDFRGGRGNKCCVAYSVIAEAIVCPLARWREIEFLVFQAVDRSNEGFAAGMLPKAVGGRSRARKWQHEVVRVTVKLVAQRQSAVVDQSDAGFNRAHGATRAGRVAKQRVLGGGEQNGDCWLRGRCHRMKATLYLLIWHVTAVNRQKEGKN